MPGRKFSIPREIIHGQGALDALKNLEASRVLIVTDPSVLKLGFVDMVQSKLQDRGIESRVFAEVEPDPSRETVEKGLAIAQEFKPDLFIGLGGGSSMDAGKAIWARYEHPDLDWDNFFSQLYKRKLRNKARYVAIPTTSGTGSEVTRALVITNRSVEPHLKTGAVSYELIPDIAIVDPILAAKMPPSVTANTGFDALVHGVESYVSVTTSDLTEGLAIKAIQLTFDWLPKAVANGDDLQAREKMHNASLLAGMAFTNSMLGIVHALAHQLGAEFGVPHGRANAFMLSYAIGYNAPVVAARYADIAKALGLPAGSPEEGTRQLIAAVRKLQREVGIPLAIKDDGISEESFMAKVDALADQAAHDANAVTNPRKPTTEEMKKLYLLAWRGAEPEVE